jgi:hypothetical protein
VLPAAGAVGEPQRGEPSSSTYAVNATYNRPVLPLGQLWMNPRPAESQRFCSPASTHGSNGVSWWNWQSASPRAWDAAAEAARPRFLKRSEAAGHSPSATSRELRWLCAHRPPGSRGYLISLRASSHTARATAKRSAQRYRRRSRAWKCPAIASARDTDLTRTMSRDALGSTVESLMTLAGCPKKTRRHGAFRVLR